MLPIDERQAGIAIWGHTSANQNCKYEREAIALVAHSIRRCDSPLRNRLERNYINAAVGCSMSAGSPPPLGWLRCDVLRLALAVRLSWPQSLFLAALCIGIILFLVHIALELRDIKKRLP